MESEMYVNYCCYRYHSYKIRYCNVDDVEMYYIADLLDQYNKRHHTSKTFDQYLNNKQTKQLLITMFKLPHDYQPEEYEHLAEKNSEPQEAVIFYLPEGASSGHFIGVFTDEQNRIHYGDSFGRMNPVFIHPKNRTVIPVKNAVQNVKTSNCGWLAMLYALTHNKTKPVDRNHNSD